MPNNVGLPLTGAGDSTASVATELLGGAHFQHMKLAAGTPGSTEPILGKGTTPGSTDMGLVVRPIGSTSFLQGIAGAIDLSSAGSTRLVGKVDVNNPTTSVTISNPTTKVDADLSSAGSTKLVGKVDVNNPTTSVNVANPTTAVTVDGTVGLSSSTGQKGSFALATGSTALMGTFQVNNPTTAVTVDGTVGLSSSTGQKGSFALASGTTGIMGAFQLATGTTGLLGTVAISSASTGPVSLLAGSSANVIGSVALVAGTSANTIGAVAQAGPGTSGVYWFMQCIPFSSGNLARTTANTSVDVSVIAANANRKALIIHNLTTVEVGLGLSTSAVTTALANVDISLGGRGGVNDAAVFGMGHNYPLFLGPIRGITVGSTAVAGGVRILEFT